MEAVQENGLALEFASKRLKDLEDIVLAAVCYDGYAFVFASERL